MQPVAEGRQRLALACALGAALALAFVALPAHPAARSDFPLDDAWIHLVYVRSLLTEGIPAYNPGVAEAGFSSPLWLLIAAAPLALCRALAWSPVIAIKLTSLAVASLAAASLGGIARRLGASQGGALVAVAIALLGTGLAEAALSGMEVALALGLLSAACCAALDGATVRAGVWLALALWARPECALSTLALGAMTLATKRTREGLADAARLTLPSLVPGALWCAYDLAVTGYLLPNTFYAKAGRASALENLTLLGRVLTEGGAVRTVLVGALLLVGIARTPSARSRRLVLGAWIAPVLGVLLSRHLTARAGFCVRRYLYAFVPLGWCFVGIGADVAFAWLRARSPSRSVAAVAAAGLGLSLLPGIAAARWQHAYNSRDIAIFHTGLARRVRAETAPSAVIGVEGAGASRYFSEREVVDVIGLNRSELVHARGRRMAYGCTLAALGPSVLVLPADLAEALSKVFEMRRRFGAQDATYAQAIPAVAHRVDVFDARVRPEYRGRCVERFGPGVRPPQ